MGRERLTPDIDAEAERRLRPRVAIVFGIHELLEPGKNKMPVGHACVWVSHLKKLDPARLGTYEQARHYQLSEETPTGDELERRLIYDAFRSFGVTKEQILELIDASEADAQAPDGAVSHRVEAFERLLSAERAAGRELAAFGAVVGQVQKAVEAVVGYARARELAVDVQRKFAFQLHGPIEALILASAEMQTSVPEMASVLGCFNPDTQMIRVLVDAETLTKGSLSQEAIETTVHETVHAISPTQVIRKFDDEGGFSPRKTRVGFYSSSSGSLRRRPRSLLALNEGVTESMARSAYAAQRVGPPWTGDSYASYVEDVATLRELADLSEDELYTIYLSKDGVIKLGKLLRERTALGPHGLSLFDIFSKEAAGGFTRFLDTMRRYHAGLPHKPIELHKSHLVTQYVGGSDRLTYPPLSPELIEQSFPFVHIRRED